MIQDQPIVTCGTCGGVWHGADEPRPSPTNRAIDRCVEELRREGGSLWDVLGAIQKTDGDPL